jgi:putative transposase
VRKTYKYRIYPTKAQSETLDRQLALCCELYNGALQERRGAYRICGKSITYTEQQNQLPEIKDSNPEFKAIHSQVLQDVLRRVDKAFAGFFARLAKGRTAGYPRFRARARYDSLSYPQSGFHLAGRKLVLSKIGTVRIKEHRSIAGRIKTLTLKREAGKWYACFSVEIVPVPLPVTSAAVGIDVGLESFAVLSDGTAIENNRYYRKAEKTLRVAQRRVARRKKGSERRKKAVRLLQRAHSHIKNQRADFHHQTSRKLVNNYGTIAVEDLNVKGLAGGMLAKSVNDAGWSAFFAKLTFKAAEAGRELTRSIRAAHRNAVLAGQLIRRD